MDKIKNLQNITKADILAAGMTRLDLAQKLDMSYQCLSGRISGFSPWKTGELEQAWKILKGA
jgi:hypothetical protein